MLTIAWNLLKGVFTSKNGYSLFAVVLLSAWLVMSEYSNMKAEKKCNELANQVDSLTTQLENANTANLELNNTIRENADHYQISLDALQRSTSELRQMYEARLQMQEERLSILASAQVTETENVKGVADEQTSDKFRVSINRSISAWNSGM